MYRLMFMYPRKKTSSDVLFRVLLISDVLLRREREREREKSIYIYIDENDCSMCLFVLTWPEERNKSTVTQRKWMMLVAIKEIYLCVAFARGRRGRPDKRKNN